MTDDRRLDRDWLAIETLEAAQRLLGCFLATERGARCVGRIVETEAYLGQGDLASHAAKQRTGRATIMSDRPGLAYVYRSYGMHAMINVVAKPEGATGAVLVRALEPVDGLDLMRRRRGIEPERLLCSGPGRLCQALGVTLDDHAVDLITAADLYLLDGPRPVSTMAGPRIGITRAVDAPYRFFDAGSPYVSAHRRGMPVEASPPGALP